MKSDTESAQRASNSNEEDEFPTLSQDEKDMRRMGKVQETKVGSVRRADADVVFDMKQRNFGLLPLLGFTTIMLCSWQSIFP